MTDRGRQDPSIRGWARVLTPLVAWIALAVAASQQPGWAAGAENAPAAGRGAAAASVGERGARAGAEAAAARGADPGPQAAEASPAAGPGDETRSRAPILYVPPSRGRAHHTAGAGTRSLPPSSTPTGPRPRVAVLAPTDHVGRTSRPSPTLYWLVSAPTSIPIELTIIDDEAIEPLLQLRLPGPIEAGLHALDLASLGIELPPGKVHRWFVALIHDPVRRSRDQLAEGAIERVVAPRADGSASGPVPSSPSASALRGEALRCAEQGLWYDALAALAEAIEQAPADRALAADRQAMLDQAKLGIALP